MKQGLVLAYGDYTRYSRILLGVNHLVLWPGQWYNLQSPKIVYATPEGVPDRLDTHPAAFSLRQWIGTPGVELWACEYEPWDGPLPMYKGGEVAEWSGAEVNNGELVPVKTSESQADDGDFNFVYREWMPVGTDLAKSIRLTERVEVETESDI